MAHARLMRSPQANVFRELVVLSLSDSDEDSVNSSKVECESSIFEKIDKDSDVTFMVEDKEIHFCKAFLSASSPVFERMFASDFKEKESGVVRLPGKTVKDVDIFLQQLHPVHCWKDLRRPAGDRPSPCRRVPSGAHPPQVSEVHREAAGDQLDNPNEARLPT